MDCNINRNNLDNHITEDRHLNHSKSFQDRKIKRYKNKNISMIENVDFRNIKNNQIKNSFKSYDDHSIMDKETKKNNHVYSDSYSYKCSKNDKQTKNPSINIDWKSLLNSTEYSTTDNVSDIKRNFKSKEAQDQSMNVYRSCNYQYRRNTYDLKRTTKCSKENNCITRKFNFLQESQLNTDKCDASSDISKDTCTGTESQSSVKTTNSSLNPSALEFTPSSNSLTSLNHSKNTQPKTDVIENGFKSLSLSTEKTIHTISNPVVIDSSEVNYTNPPLAVFSTEPAHYNKLGAVDSQYLVHNVYQCAPSSVTRTMPRVNYSIPQFPMAMYGTQPQFIRYNPPNMHGGYIVYNPLLINGMYNHCIGTPLLTNRIVSIGSADIQTGATANIAHQLSNNVTLAAYPHYYSDSINNGSISNIR